MGQWSCILIHSDHAEIQGAPRDMGKIGWEGGGVNKNVHVAVGGGRRALDRLDGAYAHAHKSSPHTLSRSLPVQHLPWGISCLNELSSPWCLRKHDQEKEILEGWCGLK